MKNSSHTPRNIVVAGTGYVGLSIATLLAQNNHVTAVDISPEKVDLINNKKSPIQDDYIEKFLTEKELDLTATLDAKAAYANADFDIVPTLLPKLSDVGVTFAILAYTSISASCHVYPILVVVLTCAIS